MNRNHQLKTGRVTEISEADVLHAMQNFGSYLDITPDDFREIYHMVYTIVHDRLVSTIHAQDLMTSPVLTIPPTMMLPDAVDFLASHDISGVPVSEDGRTLLGILSEADIARLAGGRPSPMSLLARVLHRDFSPSVLDRDVASLMTRDVVSVAPKTTLFAMIDLLNTRKINRLPVLDDQGFLVGLISRTDLLNAIGDLP